MVYFIQKGSEIANNYLLAMQTVFCGACHLWDLSILKSCFDSEQLSSSK